MDKVAQPVPTELFDTEKLFFPMLLTGVHAIQTNFTKEKRHFTYTNASGLECFRVVKCCVIKVLCCRIFWQRVENTALNTNPTCQYAEKRIHKLKNVVSVELKKLALIVVK